MFSVDGCKSPSKASKEWSGTREDLTKKKEKIEKRINQLLQTQHQKDDLQYLEAEKIDGYVADRDFRKRDEEFEDRDRFKVRKHRQEKKKFTPYDFIFDPKKLACVCSIEAVNYKSSSNHEF